VDARLGAAGVVIEAEASEGGEVDAGQRVPGAGRRGLGLLQGGEEHEAEVEALEEVFGLPHGGVASLWGTGMDCMQ
jgi:hypothetical protein